MDNGTDSEEDTAHIDSNLSSVTISRTSCKDGTQKGTTGGDRGDEFFLLRRKSLAEVLVDVDLYPTSVPEAANQRRKIERTYKHSGYDSSIITKQHATDGSSDTDKPGKLAGLGLLDGVEIIDVDFVNGIWGTRILEMLEMFLGIGLGHDAGWGCGGVKLILGLFNTVCQKRFRSFEETSKSL